MATPVSSCFPLVQQLPLPLLPSLPPQLLGEVRLSLDTLVTLTSSDFHDLMARLGLSLEEEGKLGGSLRLLSACYREPLHQPATIS